ncbi:MAG: PD40 domain-containing protein [candidate division Zixibacteria bacterium]|nr:PD40 domain-containing protein [candidate division Zixibacteria bacterium]
MCKFNFKFPTLILALLIAVSFCPAAVLAQFYFGKNKVQYTDFDWQIMTTEHFRIYFYTDEHEIAQIAAQIAEDSYRELAIRFNHELKHKTPFIIYSSPNYFSQTNIVPGILPEGVAGFTEFIKGRVVLPFHGSYHDFDHVIRHELVHVFTLDLLNAAYNRQTSRRVARPPLWFTEGLAEFWSKKWDTEADMIVKDMVVGGKLFSIPQLWRVHGTFFMYKLGESICQFIDSAYGEDKLARIFDNWYKGKNFDQVVQITLGDNLATLSKKWEYSLKKKYFPQIAELGLPKMDSRRVVKDGFAVKGVPIRLTTDDTARDYLVFKANKLGYSGLYMQPLEGPKRDVKTLIKGERSSDFESLHLLRSGIDANNSGLIVFSSKSKEKDVIYLYDIHKSKVVRRFEFDSLAAARSPRFSPDGTKIVFTGVGTDGISDIYLLDLETGAYDRLLADIYYDIDPTFSFDGSSILFSSDRAIDGPAGALNIFEYDLATSTIRQLTFGPFRDQSPESVEDGLYFSSDRGGTFNLFKLSNDGALTQQSTYVTGAFDPRLSPDKTKLYYTGYQDMSFQIYEMEISEEPKEISQPLASKESNWQPKKISRAVSNTSIKYDTDYSFDIAQSAIGFDPVYGSLGGMQVAISDMLGNHAYHFLLSNTARTKDQLLQSFNVGVTYINRKNQLNWGVGLFHLYNEYYNDFDLFFFERQVGALSLFSYPISKFHRVDFTTTARYSKRDFRFGIKSRETFLLTHYISWVYDNSLWDISGPIDGRRYNFTLGLSNSLSEGRAYNKLAMADVRHYYRLGRNSALANRLFAFTSSGLEPQRIYFGGSWSFRGYSRRAFYTRNVLFASTELRFPLIDNLLIGLPIGNMGFRGIRGVLFFDVASAWENEFDQFIGSFGTGIRFALGYLVVLRFDFTRTTDFRSISPKTDFDFFFGWNF